MEGKWKVQGYLEPGTWIVECGKEGGRADTSDAQLSQTSSLTALPIRLPFYRAKYSIEMYNLT